MTKDYGKELGSYPSDSETISSDYESPLEEQARLDEQGKALHEMLRKKPVKSSDLGPSPIDWRGF